MVSAILAITFAFTAPTVTTAMTTEMLVAEAWQKADQIDAKAEYQHEQDLKTDCDVGAKYAVEVEKQCKISTDQDMIKRVQRIGAEMADIANQAHSVATWGDKRFNTFNYTFKVIDNPEPNAFSLPGGYVYVQSGLIKFIESDDELAGVLGHEISHAKFRHIATLQKEQSKISLIQLPLMIAAILSNSESSLAAIQAGTLAGTALSNGWSVKAEEAADYGGIQLMVKSHYNPTGMLTVMERLALLEDTTPQYTHNLGIFRDHPPSKERADSMIAYLKQYGIPVQRSKVSLSFRAVVKPDDNTPGAVAINFDGRKLLTLAGTDALTRADTAAGKLNTFLDSSPQMFDVTYGDAGAVKGGFDTLLQFQPADATALSKSIPDLQKQAASQIKGVINLIRVRIWETH